MTLFGRLLRLHTRSIPIEDFFTEIVGHLFSTSFTMLCDWLEYLRLADANCYTEHYVSTQHEFDALEHHIMSSRPDLVIVVSDGTSRDVIFVESKIGSHAGVDQLKRYAEILSLLPDARQRVLLYVTRDFDPKDVASIVQGLSGAPIRFEQLSISRARELNSRPPPLG